jgi:hypothetical protein
MLRQNNQNEDGKSKILDLESLNTKYKNLLIEYKQAVANYVDYLKQENFQMAKQELTVIKGSAYWGISGLSQKTSATLEECKASCAKTPGCSGATYNPDKKCSLRSGDSEIVKGLPDNYAIVPKGKQLLKIIQDINEKLIQVNKEIQDKTKYIKNEYALQVDKRLVKNKALTEQYGILTTERNKIEKILDEYQTLDEKQIEGNINISQNYYSFILLMIITILFIYLLYKFLWSELSTTPATTSTSTPAPFILRG